MSQSAFARLLKDLDGGDVEDALSERQADIVRALKVYGGKGRLRLTLEFLTNEFGRIDIEPKVEMKKPGPPLAPTQFTAHPDGQLDLFGPSPDGKSKAANDTMH